jgi:tRNA (cmo5U34)-methyltransferase
MTDLSQTVASFFNQIAADYDKLIYAAIPRYDELLWAMFYYLPAEFQPKRILELGCGTGNLTQLIAKRWPNSQITVVDISAKMLQETGQRLKHPNLFLVESYFESLSFPTDSFDLVMASFSIHHLLDTNKKALMSQLASWLTQGGFFVMADHLLPESEPLFHTNLEELHRFARQHGALDEHIEEWNQHRQALDHYASCASFQQWLEDANMSSPTLLYAYLFNSVIQSRKLG